MFRPAKKLLPIFVLVFAFILLPFRQSCASGQNAPQSSILEILPQDMLVEITYHLSWYHLASWAHTHPLLLNLILHHPAFIKKIFEGLRERKLSLASYLDDHYSLDSERQALANLWKNPHSWKMGIYAHFRQQPLRTQCLLAVLSPLIVIIDIESVPLRLCSSLKPSRLYLTKSFQEKRLKKKCQRTLWREDYYLSRLQ